MLFNKLQFQIGSLAMLVLAILKSISGLKCYECLSLSCESPVICESIKYSMQDPSFFPKSMHIEYQVNSTCPTSQISTINNNSTTIWTNFSRECPIEDSACLEATIEIITTFNGHKNSLELDPYSTMSSVGYIRACASRKFLKSRDVSTIMHKDDCIENDTLSDIVKNVGKKSGTGPFVIQMIHSHEFYIDHGTEDAVTCYQDNCNGNPRKYVTKSHGSNNSKKLSFVPAATMFSLGALLLLIQLVFADLSVVLL